MTFSIFENIIFIKNQHKEKGEAMEEEQELTKEELQELKNLAKALRQMKNSDTQSSSLNEILTSNDVTKESSSNTNKKEIAKEIKNEKKKENTATPEYWQITDKNGNIIEDEEKIEDLEYKYQKSAETKSKYNNTSKNDSEDKTGLGVLCGIFLSMIIAIIIGCSYPNGSISRKTFFTSYWWTFSIKIIIAIFFIIVAYFVSSNSMH